ncbi:MAG: hypothetical protein ACREFD_16985 [Stellaceae bacterium]
MNRVLLLAVAAIFGMVGAAFAQTGTGNSPPPPQPNATISTPAASSGTPLPLPPGSLETRPGNVATPSANPANGAMTKGAMPPPAAAGSLKPAPAPAPSGNANAGNAAAAPNETPAATRHVGTAAPPQKPVAEQRAMAHRRAEQRATAHRRAERRAAAHRRAMVRRHAVERRKRYERRRGDRATRALDLLEARGYHDFKNFRRHGRDYAATVTHHGRRERVIVNPDSGSVRPD